MFYRIIKTIAGIALRVCISGLFIRFRHFRAWPSVHAHHGNQRCPYASAKHCSLWRPTSCTYRPIAAWHRCPATSPGASSTPWALALASCARNSWPYLPATRGSHGFGCGACHTNKTKPLFAAALSSLNLQSPFPSEMGLAMQFFLTMRDGCCCRYSTTRVRCRFRGLSRWRSGSLIFVSWQHRGDLPVTLPLPRIFSCICHSHLGHKKSAAYACDQSVETRLCHMNWLQSGL